MEIDTNSNEIVEIYVITRRGNREPLDINKITKRLQQLINKQPKIVGVDLYMLVAEAVKKLINGIKTYEIDEYIANFAASASINNPHYMLLAGRLAIDNHKRSTSDSFLDKMSRAYYRKVGNKVYSLVSEQFYKYVEEHSDRIRFLIDYERDFLCDFFGLRTFQKLYGLRVDNMLIERPQDLYMRTAIAIHMGTCKSIDEEFTRIKHTYDLYSAKRITQASPTWFNAGSDRPQYSSCFLLNTGDSAEDIMDTAKESTIISKFGGGIGIAVHCLRGSGKLIRGTNGFSSGIVPFLRIYNNAMRAFNQGGKRSGSAAIYLTIHHPDIIEFINLKLPQGDDLQRARDLFYAVWIPDLFMERVETNSMWSLFDADLRDENDERINLHCLYGDVYRHTYLQLENEKKYTKQVKARDVWELIYNSNRMTGVPYVCFSDTANTRNMQSNIGVIQSSNLCSEIYEVSNNRETAVCNLGSISLSSCVVDMADNPCNEFPSVPRFDFKMLLENVKLMTINLNNIIDKNYYPLNPTNLEMDKTYVSNSRHRPIGIGIQGLADAYIKMRFAFESEDARILNKHIMETIYYGALSQSTRICKEEYHNLLAECKANSIDINGSNNNTGTVSIKHYNPNYTAEYKTYTAETLPKNIASYPSYLWNGGSYISKGVFHWELYESKISGMYDWETLREHIKIYGVKNSLLVALMPTASTSQLLGNNECFEPYTSNIYKRTTLAGEFIIINKYLIRDLCRLGLWNNRLKDYLISLNGSIQSIDGIPDDIKNLYKTAWEIPQSELILQAIDRQPFVDQGQSLNLYIEDFKLNTFTKLMFQAWRGKLKTGKYYIHSRSAMMPQKFTLDPTQQANLLVAIQNKEKSTKFMEPLKEVCDLCSS